ncbi:MAG: hypothetical protein GKC10_03915 [Methanosarcinales archaeon]|nr:hypothetical protein [Methanosarcinales archaeon]
MELAYYYDMEGNAAMKKILDEDFFKRLGPVVREARIVGFDKDGFYMYIKAKDELAAETKEKLANTPAKLLEGEEGEAVIKVFRDEAEAAEAGMGAMFG